MTAVVTQLFVTQLFVANALAVDTMSDWTGQNSNPGNTTFQVVTTANNYGLISDTSVGGTIQSKINFGNSVEGGRDPSILPEESLDAHHVYFSDPTLVDGSGDPLTLDFTTPLHMAGTITINSPTDTEPNLLFGWYSSEDTRHRIGLGISNRSVSQGGAIANALRVDFGYAASGGNKFYYASTDGNQPGTSTDSVVPNGTYPFTFDYEPGPEGMAGGSMSATVGDPEGDYYFKTVAPLETQPWDLDFFAFDRFGFLQRWTSNVQNNPTNTYEIAFSNVTYTGGTAAAATIPGDFDGDLDVDGADLDIWKANYGTGTTVATGDADNDADADGADFLIWQRNLTGGAVAAVPEPAALSLLATGAAAALALRRRRS